MRKFMLLTLLFSFTSLAFAQKGTVNAYSRQDLLNKIDVSVAYSLPEFTEGEIFFNNGTKTKPVMNICAIDNSVRYVFGRDTLKMANISDVYLILVSGRKFVCREDSVVELLRDNGAWALGERKRLKLEEPRKEGGYGSIPPSSSARTTSNSDFSSTDTHTYGYLVEVGYSVSYDYYLIDTEGELHRLNNITSFTKAFPQHKDKIRSFVKSSKTDLSEKEGIISLFDYCLSL